jgi:hypothetical protein
MPKYKLVARAKRYEAPAGYAEGFCAGAAFRKCGTTPPRFLLVGIDRYGMGFRAGYFGDGPDLKVAPMNAALALSQRNGSSRPVSGQPPAAAPGRSAAARAVAL